MTGAVNTPPRGGIHQRDDDGYARRDPGSESSQASAPSQFGGRRGSGEARTRLIEALLFRPPVARTELAGELDISIHTVAAELRRLARAGVVASYEWNATDRRTMTLGRPPVAVALRPSAAHAIGVEVGVRTIRVAICDLAGTIVAHRSEPWFALDPIRTLDRVDHLTQSALADASLDRSTVVGVGASVALPSNPRPTAPVPDSAFSRWRGLDPGDELETRIGVPTQIVRGAAAGAFAEHHFGAGRGSSDALYVRLSAGCALGVIIGGRLHLGEDGVAGQFAHLAGIAGRRPCWCGQYGCLETMVSPEAIAAALSAGRGEPIAVPRMLDLVSEGDGRANRLIAEAGTLIGAALAPAVTLLNPQTIIVGGELARAGKALLNRIRSEILRTASQPAAAATAVVTSSHGPLAEVLGAASVQLQRAPRMLARRSAARS